MKNSTLTWNLADLYASLNDPAIAVDLSKIDALIQELVTYRNRINQLSSAELLALVKQWEAFHVIGGKLGLYASLYEATRIGDAEATRFQKQIQEQLVQKGNEILFIDVELAQLSENQWQNHLRAPELEPYRKFLSQAYRQAKHTLSESEEKILAEKNQTSFEALTHLFSLTTDTLEFDWDGEKLTLEQLLEKFHDPDPTTRKATAEKLHAGLNTNRKTTPTILNALVQDHTISDRLRHYDYPEAARYLHEDVDPETVNALTKAVNQSFALVERYYKLKKKILKTDELYWWDRYAPLPQPKATISIDQAKTMVLEAYNHFSPELGDLAKQMIDKQRIDWLPSPTKRGGAFCAFGTMDQPPYVLLNYTESLRDVMTLAHELGHAVHDMLAQQKNVYFQVHPSLALAEIASTFGEMLVLDNLLHQPKVTDQDRMSLLMGSIEDRFATVFRQITMFEFEQQLHRKRREKGELSQEQIDTLWHETMKRPFGEALIFTEEHKNTWMYVGHLFHWPFYVFTYAFAQLCSLALYQQYKEQGSEFAPRYLEILAAGGSLSPKDNLARAGLDISQPAFWQNGLSVIEESIGQLEKLTQVTEK